MCPVITDVVPEEYVFIIPVFSLYSYCDVLFRLAQGTDNWLSHPNGSKGKEIVFW